jgi:hypothetical protein
MDHRHRDVSGLFVQVWCQPLVTDWLFEDPVLSLRAGDDLACPAYLSFAERLTTRAPRVQVNRAS